MFVLSHCGGFAQRVSNLICYVFVGETVFYLNWQIWVLGYLRVRFWKNHRSVKCQLFFLLLMGNPTILKSIGDQHLLNNCLSKITIKGFLGVPKKIFNPFMLIISIWAFYEKLTDSQFQVHCHPNQTWIPLPADNFHGQRFFCISCWIMAYWASCKTNVNSFHSVSSIYRVFYHTVNRKTLKKSNKIQCFNQNYLNKRLRFLPWPIQV